MRFRYEANVGLHVAKLKLNLIGLSYDRSVMINRNQLTISLVSIYQSLSMGSLTDGQAR